MTIEERISFVEADLVRARRRVKQCRYRLHQSRTDLVALENALSEQLTKLHNKQARGNRVRIQTLFNLRQITKHSEVNIELIGSYQRYYNGRWHLDITHWLSDEHYR